MASLFCVLLLALLAAPPAAPAGLAQEWNALQQKVRDGLTGKSAARKQLVDLHESLVKTFGGKGAEGPLVFPLKDFGPQSIGGTKGSGYKPGGYDFYDGNMHKAHPAHDIFIDDADRDGLSDKTGKPVEILAFMPGVVVGTACAWESGSSLRGGKYAWILDPSHGTYCYYAHMGKVMVGVGDTVEAGQPIGVVGRTGKNAAKEKSPTHLHLMCLSFDQGAMTPLDPYDDLLHAYGMFSDGDAGSYRWLDKAGAVKRRVKDIPCPEGYARTKVEKDSFARWLRNLPLKAAGSPVHLHDGSLKPNQKAHHAVVDIDTGDRDLQQCADAIIRLRAEYLYSRRLFHEIHFNFASGFNADYPKWQKGFKIIVKGSSVSWSKSGGASYDYGSFRKYLAIVFAYANTWSLGKEMDAVPGAGNMRIGDVFIRGGFPGHAVLVADEARSSSGETLMLLLQSFMPAQDMHILRSPGKISPWYTADFGKELVTPEWTFKKNDLKRFKD